MSDFRDFLEGEALAAQEGKPSPRCSICKDEVLRQEVADYVAGRQDGSISLTVWQLWKRYFGPHRGIGAHQTIDNHIRMHLGIDL